MFTGLVETTAVIRQLRPSSRGARLGLEVRLAGLAVGESVSVNGACLTVAEPGSDGFEADLSTETLERSTLGQLTRGTRVNVERASRLGAEALAASAVQGSHLFVEGRSRLFDRPELEGRLAELMGTLDQKTRLLDMLDKWLEYTANKGREITSSALFPELASLAKAHGRKFYSAPSTLSQRLRDPALTHYFDIAKKPGTGGVFVYSFRRVGD